MERSLGKTALDYYIIFQEINLNVISLSSLITSWTPKNPLITSHPITMDKFFFLFSNSLTIFLYVNGWHYLSTFFTYIMTYIFIDIIYRACRLGIKSWSTIAITVEQKISNTFPRNCKSTISTTPSMVKNLFTHACHVIKYVRVCVCTNIYIYVYKYLYMFVLRLS